MFSDYNLQQTVLHGPFNMALHKATFVNYLEVVIDIDGVIHYAVPSHQEFIINYMVETYKYGSREALYNVIPREYWFDMMTWLTGQSGIVAVWNDRYIGILNERQKETLEQLQRAGLYKGEIK